MGLWEGAKWRVVHVGTAGTRVFYVIWFYCSLFLFAGLIRAMDIAVAFIVATIAGEVFTGVILNALLRLANRPSFLAQSVQRVMDAKDIETARDRIGEAFEDTRWYVQRQVGSAYFQGFIVKLLNEDQTLAASEVPKSYEGMVQAITSDLVDRALGDGPPWGSISNGLHALAASFGEPRGTKAIRASLSHLFLRANPVYRRNASTVKAKRKTRGLAAHPYLLVFMKYIAPSLTAAVVGAIIQKLA